MIQIYARSTNIVCININVQCKWLGLAILYSIYSWQVPHPVVSVPNDGFMEYNKWMNELIN